MSADLFAEFGSSSSGSQQQASANKPSSSYGNAQQPPALPKPSQEPAPQQWPSFQQMSAPSGADIWGDLSSLTSGGGNGSGPAGVDEDDGWGDFEVASPTVPPSSPPQAQTISGLPSGPSSSSTSAVLSRPSTNSSRPPPPPPQRTRIIRASTLDLMTNQLVDFSAPSVSGSRLETHAEQPSWEAASTLPSAKDAAAKAPSPPRRLPNKDPNVLFDADDFDGNYPGDDGDEDDDFGDFEAVSGPADPSSWRPPPSQALPASTIDLMSSEDYVTTTSRAQPAAQAPKTTRKGPPAKLLSVLDLNDNQQLNAYPNAPRSPSFQERNPFPGLALTTPKSDSFPKDIKAKSASPVTAWPALEGAQSTEGKNATADDWAAFEDFPPNDAQQSGTAVVATASGAIMSSPGWEWDVADGVQPAPAPPKPKVSSFAQQNKDTKSQKLPSRMAKAAAVAPIEPSGWEWDNEDIAGQEPPASAPAAKAAPTIDDKAPPPTNVPPPSVLLSAFPTLLALPDTALFKPTTGQSSAAKNRALTDPATATFLRGFLALATVGARVVAGRKLRWQRDRFLIQGMTISASGGKGMKLAGLDKMQTAREDSEAGDVIAAWRAVVGRLRAAVATANSALSSPSGGGPHTPLRVPELGSDRPAVQILKGALAAPRACVICGLKRDERVVGVDFDVEDSFGEWWVEHWGHRACRNFWIEHEATLRQR